MFAMRDKGQVTKLRGCETRAPHSKGQLGLVNAPKLHHGDSCENDRRVVIVIAEIKGVETSETICVCWCRASATQSSLCWISTGVAIQETCIVLVTLHTSIFIVALAQRHYPWLTWYHEARFWGGIEAVALLDGLKSFEGLVFLSSVVKEAGLGSGLSSSQCIYEDAQPIKYLCTSRLTGYKISADVSSTELLMEIIRRRQYTPLAAPIW